MMMMDDDDDDCVAVLTVFDLIFGMVLFFVFLHRAGRPAADLQL